jgi:YD repeat-containing protein
MKISNQITAWLLCILFYPICNLKAGPVIRSCFNTKDSVFKNWYYTPSGVFGRIPLGEIRERAFCEISRTNDKSVLVREYNPAGVLIKTSAIYFQKGKLSLITETNQWGEIYDSVYFKPSDQDEFTVFEKLRGRNPNLPCYALRYTYKKNLLAEILCLKDSTRPTTDRDGIAHYVFERYDDQQRFGLLKSESFFDDIDNAVISKKKDCHKITYEYDERANLITKSLLGIHDEPLEDRYGNYKSKSHYDKRDNEIQTDYYDTHGAIGGEHQTYGRLIREYGNGFLTREKHMNESYEGSFNAHFLDSATTIEYRYDQKGNLIEKTFYDEQGLPVNNNLGIHKTVLRYNEGGMLTDLAFFNAKSLPVSDEWGIHRYLFERNSAGQKISERTFNNLELPVKNILDGVFETKYKYDDWGRIMSSSYWVNDTIRTTNRIGCYESVPTYDRNGQAISVEYLNRSGQSSDNLFGFSNHKIIYDDRAQMQEIAFFHGTKPVLLKDSNYLVFNFHSIKYNYDYNNRIRSLEYFDNIGKPVNAVINFLDQAPVAVQRVEFGYQSFKLVSEKFYSVGGDGTPVVVDCKKQNNLSENGMGLKLTNAMSFDVSIIRKQYRGVSLDSFYAKQIAFISSDTVILFLDRDTYKLSENFCAGIYRVAPINRYFQFNGLVMDYFTENDRLAARLNYVEGYLDGPCTLYFRNGNIREKGEYRKNIRIGIWDYYYESGIKYKSIKFTESGNYLLESFDATGKPGVINGNGVYSSSASDVNSENQNSRITGKIKDGLMDGEWQISFNNDPGRVQTEKFSKGKFLRGTGSNMIWGRTNYFTDPVCKIDIHHPEENADHYKQNDYCELVGNSIVRGNLSGTYMRKESLMKIDAGVKEVLRSNSYTDYSGWVLLDIKYDENGKIIGKSAKLFQPNPRLEDDLLLVLYDLDNQNSAFVKRKIPFELFYIVLIEGNKMAIPENYFK